MYTPKYFEETRMEVLHDLVRTYPLGALVTMRAGGLEANHIPFELDPEPGPFGTLRGHVARANPMWRDVRSDVQSLVIFQGANSYISPSWYPTKSQTGKVVPTWNYVVVHAHGALKVVEDPIWLRALVDRLTDRHENGRNTPWKTTDAPAGYVDELLKNIVGIEMSIARLEGKWKVSQNRPAADQDGAIEGLLQQGDDLSKAMARLIRSVQPDGSERNRRED
jgi:transcriptional regulator